MSGRWLGALRRWWRHRAVGADEYSEEEGIPNALWLCTTGLYPFIAELPAEGVRRLRALSSRFLSQKEFHGAQGLEVTDAMAVAIAAQACLPLLHWGPAAQALRWYDDFVGIVVHPGQVVARREVTDEAGVVHGYDEVLAGEAMDRGPVMLSWQDVQEAASATAQGYNVVIHEFAHKLDMRDGAPDGCPPLPAGFLGTRGGPAARRAWMAVLEPAWEGFREQVIIAERFSGEAPWLDAYAAESPAEFFAVACEGYFVNRARFAAEFPALLALFDAFFRPAAAAAAAARSAR
ncbi:zinc-dependent peptidase [Xylophilus sp.]|uniref:M90 family metallopeptidase n=1 Tax=Xylophilus sp. TaxID=2653893 RepID=UPI0013B6993F|nr:M90 family metallopeptidase [Xylophilus sp.]KAF1047097.1 MAG: Protein MtfA [Xylophilus sp.]